MDARLRETLKGLDLRAEIERLRKERNAVILAHYYQTPELQDLAVMGADALRQRRTCTVLPAATDLVDGHALQGNARHCPIGCQHRRRPLHPPAATQRERSLCAAQRRNERIRRSGTRNWCARAGWKVWRQIADATATAAQMAGPQALLKKMAVPSARGKGTDRMALNMA